MLRSWEHQLVTVTLFHETYDISPLRTIPTPNMVTMTALTSGSSRCQGLPGLLSPEKKAALTKGKVVTSVVESLTRGSSRWPMASKNSWHKQ